MPDVALSQVTEEKCLARGCCFRDVSLLLQSDEETESSSNSDAEPIFYCHHKIPSMHSLNVSDPSEYMYMNRAIVETIKFLGAKRSCYHLAPPLSGRAAGILFPYY